MSSIKTIAGDLFSSIGSFIVGVGIFIICVVCYIFFLGLFKFVLEALGLMPFYGEVLIASTILVVGFLMVSVFEDLTHVMRYKNK